MSDSTAPHSPQLFFETITAFHRTGALKAAIDLGLFTAIGNDSCTAAEVAKRCECPERGIRILCDNLVIYGFITKDGDQYQLTPDSALFLNQKSPAYLGGAAKFFSAPAIADAFNDLASTIRKGRVHTSDEGLREP